MYISICYSRIKRKFFKKYHNYMNKNIKYLIE